MDGRGRLAASNGLGKGTGRGTDRQGQGYGKRWGKCVKREATVLKGHRPSCCATLDEAGLVCSSARGGQVVGKVWPRQEKEALVPH